MNEYEKIIKKYHPIDLEGDRRGKPVVEKYHTKEECETAGHIWRKGYTRKDGTYVKGFCTPHISKQEAKELDSVYNKRVRESIEENIKKYEIDKCGLGYEYVKGYYNNKGVWVKGYCRKK